MSKCPFSKDKNPEGKNFMVDFITGLIVFVIVAFFIIVVLALPVMLLWNYLLPDLTQGRLKEINFFQALALNMLCFILFRNKNFDRQVDKKD